MSSYLINNFKKYKKKHFHQNQFSNKIEVLCNYTKSLINLFVRKVAKIQIILTPVIDVINADFFWSNLNLTELSKYLNI